MAVTLVGTPTSGQTASDTSHTVTLPTGIADGDVIFVSILLDSAGATWSPPGGWTELHDAGSWAVYQRTASGDSGANHVFTSSASSAAIWGAVAYTGALTTLDASGSTNDTTTPDDTSWHAHTTGITTTVDNTMLVAFVSTTTSDATLTAPTGFTEQVDRNFPGGENGTIGVADKAQASAGATGAVAFTASVSDNNRGVLLALAPVLAGRTHQMIV